MKNKIIKIVLIIFTVLLIIPSIVYLVKNQTVMGFDTYYNFFIDKNANKIISTIIFLVLFIGMSIIYGVIVKQKPFKAIKEILIYVLIVSAIFAIMLPWTSSDIFYYMGVGELDSRYHQNPYYVTMKDYYNENKNNIDDSKVNFKYVSSAPEIVTTLALGNIRTGIVPETSLTTLLYKHSGLKILTSTNEAYEKAFNIKEGYSQFSIIVKKDFAKDNKEYVNEFLSKVKSSIDFVNKNPLQAGAYGEELSIPIKPQVLSKAIKRCNLKFIIVDEFKNNYKELFNILYNYNKEAVGGTVIDESIYYK